jgi:ABC-type molybdate transport system ATPase subunit
LDSEHTFNGYVSGAFAQQFIIFLTDKNDIYSKIGVTTNLNGYITTHLKNDRHLSKDDLSKLLNERGTTFRILLPSKDVILDIKNWNNFSVKNLLDFGFTKDEIVERKHIFNTRQIKMI